MVRGKSLGGASSSPEYQAYFRAKQRCTNPNTASWADYGGRGIEFRFENFKEFIEAVGPRPSENYSLDRIDTNGHYEVTNVRWADRSQQSGNRRRRRSKDLATQDPLYDDFGTQDPTIDRRWRDEYGHVTIDDVLADEDRYE